MCGKFTQRVDWTDIVACPTANAAASEIVASTPMRMARIIRLNDKGERENVAMRWGFADRNAANPARPAHMHARAETIDTRPTFAAAFTGRRGILVVETFNEGEELPNGKTKQWTITPRDGAPVAIAVICEEWRNGDETLWTFVQVTTPANALIAPVTDRMPAILRPQDWPAWLGETDASFAEIKRLLATYDDGGAWTIAPQELKKASARSQPDLF
ncbi:MAG: SOS response-associated peptidase family protein [Hyphomicrobium sp.]